MPPPISDPSDSGGAPASLPAAAALAGRGLADSARHAPLALFALAVGSLAIFVVVAALGAWRATDAGAVIGSIVGAFVTALLFMGAGTFVVMKVLVPRAEEPVDLAAAGEIEASIAGVLSDLEAARVETKRQVEARTKWTLPLGILGGVAFWIFTQFDEDPGGLFDLVLFCAMGGLGGYVWAEYKLSQDYRRLYKESVLPKLAARFGELTYRAAVTPDLGALSGEGVFPAFNKVTCEDEIVGTYRGLAISIVELRLAVKAEKSERVVFDGLHCAIELPRRLSGVTAVVSDEGAFGNFRARLRKEGRQRVRLEDPRFEAAYEVYGTDQVSARALLTPAFMERFTALGTLPGFVRPLALATDNRLVILLFKSGFADLFEPPGYRKPAASRAELLALHHDIEAVLGVAEAVIGLDQAARSVAASHRPVPRPGAENGPAAG